MSRKAGADAPKQAAACKMPSGTLRRTAWRACGASSIKHQRVRDANNAAVFFSLWALEGGYAADSPVIRATSA